VSHHEADNREEPEAGELNKDSPGVQVSPEENQQAAPQGHLLGLFPYQACGL
jgi:hypothetical protein